MDERAMHASEPTDDAVAVNVDDNPAVDRVSQVHFVGISKW
jgi:hypothetical protein